MTNQQERGLVPYQEIEKSLARPDQGPKPKIQAILRLNSEVDSHFQLGELLGRLHAELFEGKGEVKPWNQYILSPSTQENKQSRFARLFSVSGDLTTVSSGAELRVKKDDLNIEKDKKSFDELGISISQSMGMEGRTYIFYISGHLYWMPKIIGKNSKGGEIRRDSSGNWDSKPVLLKTVSEGRLLSFYLRSVPSMEEISQTLLQQVNEVLAELAVQGFIPGLRKSSSEEPIEPI